jgi:hypothetical protein
MVLYYEGRPREARAPLPTMVLVGRGATHDRCATLKGEPTRSENRRLTPDAPEEPATHREHDASRARITPRRKRA